jgi:RimJ/RimL family protein N-acetyltransferase
MGSTVGPPARIELADGIGLQRHHPAHAPGFVAAIAASMDELVAWMPWASPASVDVEAQRRRMEEAVARWDSGIERSYTLLSPGGEVIGSVGLHDRVGPGALEIGYWLHTAWTGRGVMTSAVGAVTAAGLAVAGIGRIEIHCDEANVRSAAIPARLGYRLDRVEDDAVQAPAETGRSMVWVFPP